MTDKDSFLYNILTNRHLKLGDKPKPRTDKQIITKPSNVTAKYAPKAPIKLKPGLGAPKQPILGSFKKGGKVKKTGLYKLHKGEKVIPVKALKTVKTKRLKAKTK